MAIPVTTTDTLTYKEILMSGTYAAIGVTVASGQGSIEAGTVMGRITASKKFGKYDNLATDGREVARGIISSAVDATSADKTAVVYCIGIFKEASMIGLDAAAKADLTACVFA